MATDRHSATSTTRRRRGPRTSTLLAAVALIPLLGAAFVGWQSASQLRGDAAAAATAGRRSEQAVHLARIQSALFDEMTWRSAAVTTETAGLEPEALNGILESDAEALLSESVRNLDSAVAESGLDDVEEAVADARAASSDLEGVLTTYTTVKDLVAGKFDRVHGLLVESAGEAIDRDVADSVAVLGMTVELRELLVEQFYGFYVSVFDVRGSAEEEIVRLIGLRSRYEEVSAALRANAGAPDELIGALDTLESDADFAQFNEGVDAVISTALKQGAELPRADGLSADATESVFAYFSPVLRTLEFSSGTIDTMLDAATSAVTTAIEQVRQEADSQIRGTGLTLAVLIAVSLAAVVLVARFIVRPLRALQSSARQLQKNPGVEVDPPSGGSAEINDAANAISEAAVHIAQAARQADALAAGDLDAPVLEENVSGGLGAALQESVATLRESLARQEEFRHRLAHEAAHDGLTQLPNRTATLASLDQALARNARTGGQLALLFVDLDDFKDVNDLHGHHAGDAALRDVAARLGASVRAGDEVGRLGGDEFLVIAEPVAGEKEAVELANRLLEQTSRPIRMSGVSFTVGASIGIALADRDTVTADQLIRDADLALYRAKEAGRGTVTVCTDELRSVAAETSTIAEGIRSALHNNELVLHYQPIVDARSEEIVALEALIRWQRPGEQDLVAPGEFIDVAERSSLIVDIDLWVLDAAASQMSIWQKADPDADWAISVNLSARHLASTLFVSDVLEALARHAVSTQRVIIEITEGALVDDLAGAARKLQSLRDAGVRVSIDDFGTGYTSLAHLRSLPFDILKIDRTFAGHSAENEYEASISKLIIDAGHLLGARVVAEGIETAADALLLAQMGADDIQGFYFYRPQPADRVWQSIVALGG